MWFIGANESGDVLQYREEYEKALLLKKASKEILEQNLIYKSIHDELINSKTVDKIYNE